MARYSCIACGRAPAANAVSRSHAKDKCVGTNESRIFRTVKSKDVYNSPTHCRRNFRYDVVMMCSPPVNNKKHYNYDDNII